MADPISQVYEAIWGLLIANDSFESLVIVGNRIKFNDDDNRSPMKDQVLGSDFPEVRIVPAGGSNHHYNTSTTSMMTRRFAIQVSTGDQRIHEQLYPVEWAIFVALTDWLETLQALRWLSKKYIVSLKTLDVSEGISDLDLNRGIQGWSTVWNCEVDMSFSTADLLPVE